MWGLELEGGVMAVLGSPLEPVKGRTDGASSCERVIWMADFETARYACDHGSPIPVEIAIV